MKDLVSLIFNISFPTQPDFWSSETSLFKLSYGRFLVIGSQKTDCPAHSKEDDVETTEAI